MAAKLNISTKHIAISKANTQMVAVVAVASFLTVFSLVASYSLWGQKGYQSRVITAKEKASKQLQANITAVDSLVSSYKTFVTTDPNVIGGSVTGKSDNDGDNAKIILDALPSKYDFPALTSSLEKVLDERNLKVTSITGTDDEVAQSSTEGSATPEAVSMPFAFSISNAKYSSVQDLIDALEHSIRPIQVDSLVLAGASNDLQLTVNAHTYYQPEKQLTITKKVVR